MTESQVRASCLISVLKNKQTQNSCMWKSLILAALCCTGSSKIRADPPESMWLTIWVLLHVSRVHTWIMTTPTDCNSQYTEKSLFFLQHICLFVSTFLCAEVTVVLWRRHFHTDIGFSLKGSARWLRLLHVLSIKANVLRNTFVLSAITFKRSPCQSEDWEPNE